MKRKKKCLNPSNLYFDNLIIISALGLILAYCTNADPAPCSNEDRIVIEHLDLKATNDGTLTLQSIDDQKEVIQMVIQTQEDYEKFIHSSTELAPIDFSKKVILAGRKKWHQCAKFKDQIVQSGCGKIFYKINIDQLDCHGTTSINFFAVINREVFKGDVEFETIIHQ